MPALNSRPKTATVVLTSPQAYLTGVSHLTCPRLSSPCPRTSSPLQLTAAPFVFLVMQTSTLLRLWTPHPLPMHLRASAGLLSLPNTPRAWPPRLPSHVRAWVTVAASWQPRCSLPEGAFPTQNMSSLSSKSCEASHLIRSRSRGPRGSHTLWDTCLAARRPPRQPGSHPHARQVTAQEPSPRPPAWAVHPRRPQAASSGPLTSA